MMCEVFRVHLIFFFFQAEDGIRDIGVTGVQTCALPILYKNIAPHDAPSSFTNDVIRLFSMLAWV